MSTPAPPAPRRVRSVRRTTIIWMAVASLAGVAIATTWATGGFGTDAKPFLGTRLQPGQTVETRFWDVAVHTAEVLPERAEIHVHVTAVNKQRRTLEGMTPGMVAVRLPDGVPMTGSTCLSDVWPLFAPLIPVPATCVFGYERNDVPPGSVPHPGPFDIEFVVLDQELSDDLLTVPSPQAGEPAGWLPMSVSVAPQGQS